MGTIRPNLAIEVKKARKVLRVIPRGQLGGSLRSYTASTAAMAAMVHCQVSPHSTKSGAISFFNLPTTHARLRRLDKISGSHRTTDCRRRLLLRVGLSLKRYW